MSYTLFIICLLINLISTENNSQCLLLNNKLSKYGITINNHENNFPSLKLCQNLINNSCCSQIDEDKIQNATAIELYQLFELHSMNLYQPLIQLTNQFNSL